MIPKIPSDLKQEIISLDGKGYKAYKSFQEKFFYYGPFTVRFEHVQGDSFAQPTRLSISIGVCETGFPPSLFNNPIRELALEDHLLRRVNHLIATNKVHVSGSGKSGKVQA